MKAGEKPFVLTPKGVEELRSRAPKLDAHARSILTLIDQGANSPEAILHGSKSSHDDVINGLRSLLSKGFVVTGTESTSRPTSSNTAMSDPTPSIAGSTNERLKLKAGISPSQARFLLSNFALDQFGQDGKDLADVVEFCTDVPSLQMALDSIRTELKKLFPERRPLLVACVQEINETDF
jgi:hypothetical protein